MDDVTQGNTTNLERRIKDLENKSKIRTTQRTIRTGEVRQHSIGNIIQRFGTFSEASAVVPSGSTVIITASVTAKNGNTLFADFDRATYVGSKSASNEIAVSGGINNLTLYPMWIYKSLTGTDGHNVVERQAIYNNSGGDKTIISDIQARFLINFGGTGS